MPGVEPGMGKAPTHFSKKAIGPAPLPGRGKKGRKDRRAGGALGLVPGVGGRQKRDHALVVHGMDRRQPSVLRLDGRTEPGPVKGRKDAVYSFGRLPRVSLRARFEDVCLPVRALYGGIEGQHCERKTFIGISFCAPSWKLPPK